MLIYNNIKTQQSSNNTQRTMKREHGCIKFCHHFFFSLSFVEDKLSMYYAIYQCIAHHFQQFNAFTYINKSAGKWQGNPNWNYLCRHSNKQP